MIQNFKHYVTYILCLTIFAMTPINAMEQGSGSFMDLVKSHPVLVASGAVFAAGAFSFLGQRAYAARNVQNRAKRISCVEVSTNPQEIKGALEQGKKNGDKWHYENQLAYGLLKRFHSAIAKGNMTVVQVCLESYPDPLELIYKSPYYADDGMTRALKHDNNEIVKLFRSYEKTDTHSVTATDKTESQTQDTQTKTSLETAAHIPVEPCLISAIKLKARKTVKMLLEDPVNCQVRTVDGKTALHHAVQAGDSKILALIVAQGLDVTATDNQGKTSLELLNSINKVDILPLLRSKDFKLEPELYQSLLSKMVCHNKIKTVRWLLAHKPSTKDVQMNEKQNTTTFPIMRVAETGNVEMMRLLLEDDPTLVEVITPESFTPLINAAQEGHVEALRLLLKYRRFSAKASQISLDDPLSFAAGANKLCAVQVLLEEIDRFKESINDECRLIALRAALRSNQNEMASYLIESLRRLKPNKKNRAAVDEEGNTFWHQVAMRKFHEGVMHQLLSWYTQKPNCLLKSLHTRNNDGQTAIGLAMLSHNKMVLEYLQKIEATAN